MSILEKINMLLEIEENKEIIKESPIFLNMECTKCGKNFKYRIKPNDYVECPKCKSLKIKVISVAKKVPIWRKIVG